MPLIQRTPLGSRGKVGGKVLGVAPQIQETSWVLAPTRIVDCIWLSPSVPLICQAGASPLATASSASSRSRMSEREAAKMDSPLSLECRGASVLELARGHFGAAVQVVGRRAVRRAQAGSGELRVVGPDGQSPESCKPVCSPPR